MTAKWLSHGESRPFITPRPAKLLQIKKAVPVQGATLVILGKLQGRDRVRTVWSKSLKAAQQRLALTAVVLHSPPSSFGKPEMMLRFSL